MREGFGDAARRAHTTDTLGRLVPLWPSEIEDRSPAGRQHLLAALRKALRSERQRGLTGHWTYDLARHWNLLEAYRAEALAAMTSRLIDEAQQSGS